MQFHSLSIRWKFLKHWLEITHKRLIPVGLALLTCFSVLTWQNNPSLATLPARLQREAAQLNAPQQPTGELVDEVTPPIDLTLIQPSQPNAIDPKPASEGSPHNLDPQLGSQQPELHQSDQPLAPTFTLKKPVPLPQPLSSLKEKSNGPELNQSQGTANGANNISDEFLKRQKLIEADNLYLAGNTQAAEAIYKAVKPAFTIKLHATTQTPYTDPAQLPIAGQVYWREAQDGIARQMKTKAMVALKLLTENVPEFVPGHIHYAEVLQTYATVEEAIVVMEKATSLYPNQPDLIQAKVKVLQSAEKWLEASLAARQFALLNPEHPATPALAQSAQENLDRFRGSLQEKLTGNAIASFFTGALTYAVTGSLFGPLNALQTTVFLLQGEAAIGESIANDAQQQLDMVTDPVVQNYVNELGQKLAKLTGRDDFKYRFYVIKEPTLNAFALPGGQVFINSGAILKAQSEAELAGLISHEISHTVLSHGFQILTQAAVLGNLTQLIPLGGTIANLVLLDYSRDMEWQADILGTRILTSGGYAADGLHNLMITMAEDNKGTPFPWLSSHPVTNDRVAYLEELIQRNGYNRYTFEGIERHSQIQARVEELQQADREKTSIE